MNQVMVIEKEYNHGFSDTTYIGYVLIYDAKDSVYEVKLRCIEERTTQYGGKTQTQIMPQRDKDKTRWKSRKEKWSVSLEDIPKIKKYKTVTFYKSMDDFIAENFIQFL